MRIEVGGWEGGSGAQTGLFFPPSPSLHEVDVAQPVLFSFFYVISKRPAQLASCYAAFTDYDADDCMKKCSGVVVLFRFSLV